MRAPQQQRPWEPSGATIEPWGRNFSVFAPGRHAPAPTPHSHLHTRPKWPGTGMVYRSLLYLLVASGPSAGSTPPSPGDSAVTVFTPGEAGADGRRWTCYRIPVLILVNETLLAFAEARSYTGDG